MSQTGLRVPSLSAQCPRQPRRQEAEGWEGLASTGSSEQQYLEAGVSTICSNLPRAPKVRPPILHSKNHKFKSADKLATEAW